MNVLAEIQIYAEEHTPSRFLWSWHEFLSSPIFGLHTPGLFLTVPRASCHLIPSFPPGPTEKACYRNPVLFQERLSERVLCLEMLHVLLPKWWMESHRLPPPWSPGLVTRKEVHTLKWRNRVTSANSQDPEEHVAHWVSRGGSSGQLRLLVAQWSLQFLEGRGGPTSSVSFSRFKIPKCYWEHPLAYISIPISCNNSLIIHTGDC